LALTTNFIRELEHERLERSGSSPEVPMAAAHTEEDTSVEASLGAEGVPHEHDTDGPGGRDDDDADGTDSDEQLGQSDALDDEADLDPASGDEAPSDEGDDEADAASTPVAATRADAARPLQAAARAALQRPANAPFFRTLLAAMGASESDATDRLRPLLREFVRERVAEPEAFAELVELYADGADRAFPIITALATRGLLLALRQRGASHPDPARVEQLARDTERAAEVLAGRRGRRALHQLPQLLARALQRNSEAVARSSTRRFRIPGPVEIVIFTR
jgi:hypothetical protein